MTYREIVSTGCTLTGMTSAITVIAAHSATTTEALMTTLPVLLSLAVDPGALLDPYLKATRKFLWNMMATAYSS